MLDDELSGQEEGASVAVQIHRASGWLDTRHHRLQPRHDVPRDECGTIDDVGAGR
jgi:hypothetical protein